MTQPEGRFAAIAGDYNCDGCKFTIEALCPAYIFNTGKCLCITCALNPDELEADPAERRRHWMASPNYSERYERHLDTINKHKTG